MAKIYRMARRKFPGDPAPCLEKLAEHAKNGTITGVAFIALMDDEGYIADTCGDATHQPDKVRQLLKALDAKVAKRQLASRR